jgi:hypothetical protein
VAAISDEANASPNISFGGMAVAIGATPRTCSALLDVPASGLPQQPMATTVTTRPGMKRLRFGTMRIPSLAVTV